MNVIRAELYRYRKSIYGKAAMAIVIVIAIGVICLLNYANKSIDSSLLRYLGFDKSDITSINALAGRWTIIYPATSAVDIIMLITGICVVMHICSDYEQRTIRFEHQSISTRAGCYMSRVAAATIYMVAVYLIYLAISFSLSLFLTDNRELYKNCKPEGLDASQIGTAILMIVSEMIIISGLASLILFLCEIITNQIIAIAAFFIMVIAVTPGINIISGFLSETFNAENVWIINMLTAYSDGVISFGKVILLTVIGLVYFAVFSFAGFSLYKRRKL